MTAQTFEKLYRDYSKKLFRICLLFTRDEELAAEMIQDIFCSIWERRAELDVQEWDAYLYRSAKLKYYNYYRNRIS